MEKVMSNAARKLQRICLREAEEVCIFELTPMPINLSVRIRRCRKTIDYMDGYDSSLSAK